MLYVIIYYYTDSFLLHKKKHRINSYYNISLYRLKHVVMRIKLQKNESFRYAASFYLHSPPYRYISHLTTGTQSSFKTGNSAHILLSKNKQINVGQTKGFMYVLVHGMRKHIYVQIGVEALKD